MTDKERFLAFLRSLSPKSATNGEIRQGTHTREHHQPSFRHCAAVRLKRRA
jgi:hypothetical protein